MAARIAVVGVGAIGGVCAANLIAVGREVVCCVRTPFSALEVEAPGASLLCAPRVETDPAHAGAADWILLATKAHQTAGAAGWLAALAGADTRLAVLHNGVEHVERLSPWFDPARIVPVVVECPATATAPGRIAQRRAARLSVPDRADARDFAALFAGSAVAVETSADWKTAAWRKLCTNVTSGAIAALAGVALQDVVHPRRAELAHALAGECAEVARAEGADLPAELAQRVAEGVLSAPVRGTPSTLVDRLAGRPLETDARNGAVVRIGARHGIPVPVNARAAELMMQAHLDPRVDLLPKLAEALR
jgi:2-dehydropantoate 2-reductase